MRLVQRKWFIIVSFVVAVLIAYILGVKSGETLSLHQSRERVSELAQPNMTTSQLEIWVNQAAMAILSYNYADYRQQLQQASQYFSPEGWKAYQQALQKSTQLEQVIKQQIVATAVATGAPMILEQGAKAGKYTWKVQIPMLVTYNSKTAISKQQLMVTMIIERTSKYLGKDGLGIVAFVSKAS